MIFTETFIAHWQDIGTNSILYDSIRYMFFNKYAFRIFKSNQVYYRYCQLGTLTFD